MERDIDVGQGQTDGGSMPPAEAAPASFSLGVPVPWLGLALAALGIYWSLALWTLAVGAYGGLVLSGLLLLPLCLLGFFLLVQGFRSFTAVEVDDQHVRCSKRFGADRVLPISELREVRLEQNPLMLHQVTFETHQWQTVSLRIGASFATFAALTTNLANRTDIPYAGSKTRTFRDQRRLVRGNWVRFKTYLDEETPYQAASVDDVERWLADCRYEFDRWDVWLPPGQFEQRRSGDCEDHALWAWNKLHRLGLEPEFVLGRWLDAERTRGDRRSNHAWVRFRLDGVLTNFETVRKDGTAVQPWKDVQDRYEPYYSIDIRNRTFRHRRCWPDFQGE